MPTACIKLLRYAPMHRIIARLGVEVEDDVDVMICRQ